MNDRFDPRKLYDIYRVQIQFRGRLYGGVPKNKELIADWIKAKTGYDDEIAEGLTEAAKAQMIDEESEKSWNGFFRDEQKGVYIECRQLKAALKQCASVLGLLKKKIGSKQILAEGGEIKSLDGGDRLYLNKQEVDGFEERPIHVMTAQGPRTALKRVDYCEEVKLDFEVWVLQTEVQEKRHVGEDELVQILTLMQENGVGADRSQGGGKFSVTEFEKVQSGMSRAASKDDAPAAPPKAKRKAVSAN
jgi:CRISPR/Cas system CSM-associated protein Csm4 (group 5 of RAMP superfamily)